MSRSPFIDLAIEFAVAVDDLRGGIAALACVEKNVDKMGDLATLDEALRKVESHIRNVIVEIMETQRERNRKNRGYR